MNHPSLSIGFKGRKSDILVYSVGSDNQTATLVNTINTGITTNALSFDFAPDSKYIYYTSTSADNGYQLNRVASNATSVQTIASLGKPASIALAPNNKLYVSAAGNTTLTEVVHNATEAPDLRDVSLNMAAGYQLTGVLPLQPHTVLPAGGDPYMFTRHLGFKNYELKDDLGNVRAVFSDRKLSDLVSGQPANFRCDLLSATNYYPFGMEMPKRIYNSPNYRYGFNGKEKDDEVNGNGVTYDYGFRIYDARVARWLSLDPSMKKYPNLSPYNAFENNPIIFKDPDGKDATFTVDEKTNTITVKVVIIISNMDATAEKAASMQNSINKVWGGNFTHKERKKTYNMKFDVQVRTRDQYNESDAGASNLIVLFDRKDLKKGRSFVSGGWKGKWAIDESDGYKTYAHEFGHLIGLDDQYIDLKGGEIKLPFMVNPVKLPDIGRDATGTPKNEIMGVAKANPKVSQNDIDNLFNFITKNKDGNGNGKISVQNPTMGGEKAKQEQEEIKRTNYYDEIPENNKTDDDKNKKDKI